MSQNRLKCVPLALAMLCNASMPLTPTEIQAEEFTTASKARFAYPPAKRGDVVDDYHGVKVADPYRWLEKLDSVETRAWVLAEAQLTEAYLAKIPARQTLKARLTKLLDFEKYSAPFHKGQHYFYSHNSGLQPQSVLYTTLGLTGAPAVAFDPNTISTNGSLAVVGYAFSRDGARLAYGVSQGGSDWADWHIRDLASGQDLPDELRWTKYYAPIFAADGKGLYYSAFPAPTSGEELRVRDLSHAVYYHALGTPTSADRKLYSRPDHADWQFAPHLTHDGQWLVLLGGEGEVGDKGLENIYALDLRQTNPVVTPLSEGFAAGYHFIGAEAGLFYFQTTLDAPRGRVIAINPNNPRRDYWQEIIPQGADTMDVDNGSVSLVNHQLIVRTLHDVHSQVKVFGLDGRLQREVELPGLGTASGFGGELDDHETFYSYTDLATPSTIYRYDLRTGASIIYRAPKVAFDPATVETKQVFYPSKDGTRIPMFLVYKKGLKLDGSNPTLLTGYGGFGISVLPRFDAARLLWLERGGIFASANLRGGGEYGEQWHRQAIRNHKQIVFDDFIAAAQWLIAQKYTSAPKLAIEGGSNGGLLVGACATQRPDLFGVVLAHVGVMDMLRFNLFGQGAGWEGDYGSPQNPDDFRALHAYSPYHNVRPGTHYPAMFIVTGDHDARVMPAHSFKFAAAMQAAQAGLAPILLRVQLSAGHGGGPTTSQFIDEKADAYAFLLANMGMDVN
jgi:prolyl oligopeptidase